MGINLAFKGLNPICHLLALLGAHHILHVSRIMVNSRMSLCCLSSNYVLKKSNIVIVAVIIGFCLI